MKLKSKLKESMLSVLPIAILVLVLCFTVVPISLDIAVRFLIGLACLALGLALFAMGLDTALTPTSRLLGSFVAKKNKLWFIALAGAVLGFFIVVTEPDLHVLSRLVVGIPHWTFIVIVAIGTGLFLALAFLRELLHINIKYVLLALYPLVFFLALFVPENFLPTAFDAGGATTGVIAVPFIMALGVGIASSMKGKCPKEDNFGLISICCIGPIFTVMILGLIYTPDSSSAILTSYSSVAADTTDIGLAYLRAIPSYLIDVSISLLPIFVLFVLFQCFALKSSKGFARSLAGMSCVFVGLVLFLTGASTGFSPMGYVLGYHFANLGQGFVLIAVGVLFGFCVSSAEPAIYVLKKQVSEVTEGAISKTTMRWTLAIAVSLAIGLAMVRVLTGISILWILLPGYALAVGLSFFVPKIFVSIAFDAGGVISGPLTVTFLLPFAIGASTALGTNAATDAFGLVAMVAMVPLVTIQMMGLYLRLQEKRKKNH